MKISRRRLLISCAILIQITVSGVSFANVSEQKSIDDSEQTVNNVCSGASNYIKYAFNDKRGGAEKDESIYTNLTLFRQSAPYKLLSLEEQLKYDGLIRAITYFVYNNNYNSVKEYKSRFMLLCSNVASKHLKEKQ